jgi:hypothetical protein
VGGEYSARSVAARTYTDVAVAGNTLESAPHHLDVRLAELSAVLVLKVVIAVPRARAG